MLARPPITPLPPTIRDCSVKSQLPAKVMNPGAQPDATRPSFPVLPQVSLQPTMLRCFDSVMRVSESRSIPETAPGKL